MPAVLLARGEPRERAERPGYRRADDRGLGADGEDVRADRAERAGVADESR